MMPSNNPHPERNLTSEGRSKGGRNSAGNFRHNPQRAAEAGRKGGQARTSQPDNAAENNTTTVQ